MLKVSNIRLPVGESETELLRECANILRMRQDDVAGLRILRKSLDIRDKGRIEHVFSVAVDVADESFVLRRIGDNRVTVFRAAAFHLPLPGDRIMRHRPIVVGAGPAGLFAAILLAENGYCPIVLERGKKVRERSHDVRAFDLGGPLDPESNYLFGEGGAGTFSDGKLTCRTTGPDTTRVLEILAASKGKPSILYEARPHLGSNRLPAVVKALRRRILDAGGEFGFSCRVDDLVIRDASVAGVATTNGYFPADVVVLATGHSARATYAMLADRGVAMRTKPFQMGVRIEQPQEIVNHVQYGASPQAALFGPADYTLNVRVEGRDLFTFCMCAGGYVMPSVSEHGFFCTNGMSRSRHESMFANSGLVVTVDPGQLPAAYGSDALIGVRYQAEIENRAYRMTGESYYAPVQWAKDFLELRRSDATPRSSYRRGTLAANLWDLMPIDVARLLQAGLPLMDRRWNGAFLRDATLTGPEARGSCPLRIVRNVETRQSPSVSGLYPVGEGAGYAGGIVSAAVDGLRTAKSIIAMYQPFLRR